MDQDNARYSHHEGEYQELLASHERLEAALWRSIEVMEFAYMNAPKQPREIAEAREALKLNPKYQKGA